MNNSSKSATAGVSTVTVVQIVLIILKLFKLIDWTWFWVFAPTWIPLSIMLFLILLFFLIAVIFGRKIL